VRTRRRCVATATAAGVLAYGWWFTGLTPFRRDATRAWLLAVAALVLAGATHRRLRHETAVAPTRASRSGVALWSALVVAVVTWELLALRSSPRSEHPTISSFVESVEQWHVVRLALFAGWLTVGWVIAA
jgi:hypothetical protein